MMMVQIECSFCAVDATVGQIVAEFLPQTEFTNFNKQIRFQVQNLLYSN